MRIEKVIKQGANMYKGIAKIGVALTVAALGAKVQDYINESNDSFIDDSISKLNIRRK